MQKNQKKKQLTLEQTKRCTLLRVQHTDTHNKASIVVVAGEEKKQSHCTDAVVGKKRKEKGGGGVHTYCIMDHSAGGNTDLCELLHPPPPP